MCLLSVMHVCKVCLWCALCACVVYCVPVVYNVCAYVPVVCNACAVCLWWVMCVLCMYGVIDKYGNFEISSFEACSGHGLLRVFVKY